MLNLIDIIDKQDINGYFQYNIDMFKDFIKKGNKVTLIFESKNIKINTTKQQQINLAEIKLFEYKNYKELISFLKSKSKPVYINTFYEQYILLANKLKKFLGQPTTKNLDIFFDKSKLKEKNRQQITIIIGKPLPKKINSLKYPIFIKPTCGTSSIGSAKINNKTELQNHLNKIDKSIKNLKERGLNTKKLLIEDFIEGNLYSMNYLVTKEGIPIISKTQKMRDNLGYDTHLICGEISQQAHEEINKKEFLKFAKKTIKTYGIKNTFICHQFKKTPDGKFKTIEINGRIGGFNIETYKLSFDFNFLDLLTEQNKKYESHGSSAFIRFYPKQEQIFKGYNQDILQKIKSLKSNYRGYIFPKKIGEIIGTPKNGYFYYGILILYNKNYEQFEQDFKRIKDNYYKLFL